MHRIPSLGAVLLACGTAAASAADTRFLVFDLEPSTIYSVGAGRAGTTTVNSSSEGVLAFTAGVASGDVVTLSTDGSVPVPPSPPAGLAVVGGNDGCASASWQPNNEPDVVLYRLYHRPAAAPAWADSVDVTGDTTAVVCGLSAGTHEFAVRAGNAAGLLSAMSSLISASVSTGDAQPPPPPHFISAKAGDPGCAVLKWQLSSDPTVVGYVVEYGKQSVPGEAGGYPYSVDAGAVSTLDVCDLVAGDYYFVVRARNYAGILSAYSSELPVAIVVVSVYITRFDAGIDAGGVLLEWEIRADENVDEFQLMRTSKNGSGGQVVFDIDPAADHFVDRTVLPGTGYSYVLVAVSADGRRFSSVPATVTTPELQFALEANVPNPFNPRTAISFTLPAAARARIDIFDVAGRLVDTIVDGALPAGRHTEYWNGRTATGAPAPSGTYFYRLTSPSGVVARKMLLVK